MNLVNYSMVNLYIERIKAELILISRLPWPLFRKNFVWFFYFQHISNLQRTKNFLFHNCLKHRDMHRLTGILLIYRRRKNKNKWSYTRKPNSNRKIWPINCHFIFVHCQILPNYCFLESKLVRFNSIFILTLNPISLMLKTYKII